VLGVQASEGNQPAARMNRIRFYSHNSQLIQGFYLQNARGSVSGNRLTQRMDLARQIGWPSGDLVVSKSLRVSKTNNEAFA